MNQSAQYAFAHTVLPVLALWNKQKFYNDAFSPGGKKYLTEIWNGTARRINVQTEQFDLGVQNIAFEDSTDALLITLPPPTTVGEAFRIAVVATLRNGFFRKTVTAIRYFTLELGNESAKEVFICEWTSPVPKPARVNHGKIVTPDPRLFLSRVKQIVQDHITTVINSEGAVAGSVQKDDSGRSTITVPPNSDYTSFLFSTFIIIADSLDELPVDRSIFTKWAGFPDTWTSNHKQYFALAMLQHFDDAKKELDRIPSAIRDSISKLPEVNLPALHRPLTEEVRQFFNSLFGG
jgi:hypothetical protein